MALNIFCDGGARGNPGPAACAFVICDDSGKLRDKRGKYLGIATNNEAEYQAVLEALSWLKSNLSSLTSLSNENNPPKIDLHFFLDSNLVVNQINGLFKVKSAKLQEFLVQIRLLENSLTIHYPLLTTDYTHIPREQNRQADQLVNETLDKQLFTA